jgi:hypothetical protein
VRGRFARVLGCCDVRRRRTRLEQTPERQPAALAERLPSDPQRTNAWQRHVK